MGAHEHDWQVEYLPDPFSAGGVVSSGGLVCRCGETSKDGEMPDTGAGLTPLQEAAAWIANGIGYPVQVTMPDCPPPAALWEAIVDHVHADSDGAWHGKELSREEVDDWLRDEAGLPEKEQ